mgnify:CR=1 FL=1
MTKQEFLAMSLPYGLKMCYTYENRIDIQTLLPMHFDCKCQLVNERGKPVLRPLSDLTKPIEHNGEKFIPALELVKLEEKYNHWKEIAPTIPYDIKIINKPFGKVLKVSKVEHWVIYLSLNEIERAKYYIVSQLIKWHFDMADLISKGEAIDVNTLEINPYK